MNPTYLIGDATSPKCGGRKIIAHVCNDVGAWGKGFVLALTKRWRAPEHRYRAWCYDNEFGLGQVQFVQVEPDIWVANMIGQHGISTKGGTPPIRYEAVRRCLRDVALKANELNASVHMPRIGCGLAGGRWEIITQIIDEELVKPGIDVTVYDPTLHTFYDPRLSRLDT